MKVAHCAYATMTFKGVRDRDSDHWTSLYLHKRLTKAALNSFFFVPVTSEADLDFFWGEEVKTKKY